jgi:hypothetical protein
VVTCTWCTAATPCHTVDSRVDLYPAVCTVLYTCTCTAYTTVRREFRVEYQQQQPQPQPTRQYNMHCPQSSGQTLPVSRAAGRRLNSDVRFPNTNPTENTCVPDAVTVGRALVGSL